MAYEATPAAAAWRVFWPTRMAVLLVAVFAALSFGPATGGLAEQNAVKFDTPELTHAFADPLLAPLARWDAVWYLRVAESGYGEGEAGGVLPALPAPGSDPRHAGRRLARGAAGRGLPGRAG